MDPGTANSRAQSPEASSTTSLPGMAAPSAVISVPGALIASGRPEPALANETPLLSEKRVRWADRLGICLSGLCLIHCLLTPLVIVLIPSLEIAAYHDWFHDALLVVLPLIAVTAFIPGFRRHRDPVVFYWSAPGLVLIAVGALVFEHVAWGQVIFSVAGSVLLIRAHVMNRRLCACCGDDHAH